MRGKKQKNSFDWNPDLYMRFNEERLQPSIDLTARIKDLNPANILDVGCGAGNSTQILRNKWPSAEVIGIDKSPSMIEAAKKEYPEYDWRIQDICNDFYISSFDLIFSNATIQWVEDQRGLLQRLLKMVNPEGCIAFQLPVFWNMKLGEIIKEVLASNRWNHLEARNSDKIYVYNNEYYYDALVNICQIVEFWETTYMHIFQSHVMIFEMIKSTGLKPYYKLLSNPSEVKMFEEDIFKEIKLGFPLLSDGNVVLPFRRLFFISTK
ncbi:MAG: methyltransferase domain-containing protein [Bacteroidales bacterium]